MKRPLQWSQRGFFCVVKVQSGLHLLQSFTSLCAIPIAMRKHIHRSLNLDPRLNYRGLEPTRLDNLTDAVFGIAITLLIFNLKNPNSFVELLQFTKTLPAFLASIAFLLVVWSEHLWFSRLYGMDNRGIAALNVLFIGLIIFYVYPLRLLTLWITNWIFASSGELRVSYAEVPLLVVYFGVAVFLLYFIIFLMYVRAGRISSRLALGKAEQAHTKLQTKRLVIM